MSGDSQIHDEAKFRQSLMLGTARHPVPLPEALAQRPKGLLAALALLSQRDGYRRAPPPPAVPRPKAPEDRRPLVPDALRPLLLRLFGPGGHSKDAAAWAVLDALREKNLRLHPFDLVKLEGLLQRDPDALGPGERLWLERRGSGEADEGWSLAGEIDDDNWDQCTPALRAAFIRERRLQDAEQARALVEPVFASEKAALRAQLVKALGVGLSAADQPFLESLSKDRAPSVKAAAEVLLIRIPGSGAQSRNLENFLGRIKEVKGKLLKRSTGLTLETPLNLKTPRDRQAWAAEHFAGLSLQAVSDGLKTTPDAMIYAAREDKILMSVFACQAVAAGEPAMLQLVLERAKGLYWLDLLENCRKIFQDPASDGQRECLRTILNSVSWKSLPEGEDLLALYGLLRRPLDQATAERLLSGKGLAKKCADLKKEKYHDKGALLCALVALLPPALRPQLAERIGDLPHEVSARPLALMQALERIEQA